MRTYSVRRWLNPPSSAATGSVVAFDGKTRYADKEGNRRRDTFLKVSDCMIGARIHPARFDRPANFAKKLRILAKVVSDFADYIEGLRTDWEQKK